MPNKVRRNSVVDMLAKVPVNRGSLLTSIENLLKTIESSESAVMIPTLLRDKCEFDAWELLFVAKILKASILGHSDLVEFYMNHIHNTSSQFAQQQQQQQTNGDQSSPVTARRASPASSPSGLGSNGLAENGTSTSTGGPQANGFSSSASVSSVTTTTTTTSGGSNNGIDQHQQHQQQQVGLGSPRSQSTANSWATAANQVTSSGGSSTAGSLSGGSGAAQPLAAGEGLQSANFIAQDATLSTQQQLQQPLQSVNQEVNMAAAGGSPANSESPLSLTISRQQIAGNVRQAQPPSLLQLTTTNNHINSMAASAHSFSNNNIEQLTNQLTAMQANGCLSGGGNGTASTGNCNGLASTTGAPVDGALSISTTTANQQQQSSPSSGTAAGGQPATPTSHAHELRTSRSAGCLFRMNSSGASSPRTPAAQTPTTPAAYPQAETLAAGQNHAPFAGCDPSTPVKLLLQIEQLKSSIKHVTYLLDSVVELYKKSIDNIALA